MRKKILSLTAVVVFSALCPLGSLAQDVERIKDPEKVRTTTLERINIRQQVAKKYPLLQNLKTLDTEYSPLSSIDDIVQRTSLPSTRRSWLGVGVPTTIWGNVVWRANWTTNNQPYGMYSLSPSAKITPVMMSQKMNAAAAGSGVQFKNGKFYAVNFDRTILNDYGIVSAYLTVFDAKTWEYTRTQLPSNYYSLIATETAQAEDGTVWGEFYNSDFSKLQIGTVDYSSMTQHIVGAAAREYVAMGITKAGVLYGVGTDGNLYKINKSTGSDELVGSTGITVTSSGHYPQSGEINQKDDKFYWAVLDANANAGLYTVDLSKGAATKVGDYDVNTQVLGMYIPKPEATDKAPSKITDIVATFENGEKTGKVSFTLPTVAYDSTALSGTLTYSISVDGSVVKTGTGLVGSKVNEDITVSTDGQHTISVTTSNAEGSSPEAVLLKWIGYDVPSVATNVKMTVNGQRTTIVWTAPTTGVHGGYLGQLTYDVYRATATDTVEVAKGIANTSASDNVPEALADKYTYIIYVNNGSFRSAGATSNGDFIGTAFETPYNEPFDDASSLNLCTIIDANNDGFTWNFFTNNLIGNKARTLSNPSSGNDDWLITPPIHLKRGKTYTVTYEGEAASYGASNSMEVKYGKDKTVAAMTSDAISKTTLAALKKEYSNSISVNEDGDYYFGIHDATEVVAQGGIYLENFSVIQQPDSTAPGAATELTVTPADKGQLSATISFKVPAVDIKGNAIETVDSIKVLRDGKVIATIGRKIAGADVQVTDEGMTNGNHTYTVVAYNASGFGAEAETTAFIGEGRPASPNNSYMVDNQNSVTLKWDRISDTGRDGRYVNPDNVAVEVIGIRESTSGGYYEGDSLTISDPGATEVTIAKNTDEGSKQNTFFYFLRSIGAGGESDDVTTEQMVVGPAYTLPFRESWKNGQTDNGFAWTWNNRHTQNFKLVTDMSSDADGGSAVWNGIYNGEAASINTGKISLAGAANPKLIFKYYSKKSNPARLKVLVSLPDHTTDTVKVVNLSRIKVDGWYQSEYKLAPYKDQRYVILKFFAENTDSAIVGVDDINVFDQKSRDMAVTNINVQQDVVSGKNYPVEVTVKNLGELAADSYKLLLSANDSVVDSIAVTEPLGEFADKTFTLQLPVPVTSLSTLNVKAIVVYDGDLEETNNVSDVKTVTVEKPKLPFVDDLTASGESNVVNLSWTAPSGPYVEKETEDFESYEPFSTNFGRWTLYDGNKGYAGPFFNRYAYPHQGEQFAFIVFNPNAITGYMDVVAVNPEFTPHSGSQYAAVPYEYSSSAKTSLVAGNNWLVSPTLSGNAQTIDFYVHNDYATQDNGSVRVYPETFDVLYSTTDSATTSFVKIGNTYTSNTNSPSWQEVSVDIPAGAKYFAIHQNTPMATTFLFGVDDISYEAGYYAAAPIECYNIYRDGILVGTVKAGTTSFRDVTTVDGSHTYNVSVVYADGNESMLSNDARIATAIQQITTDGTDVYDVYTLDGKLVRVNAKSLNGLEHGVYIINGNKVAVK